MAKFTDSVSLFGIKLSPCYLVAEETVEQEFTDNIFNLGTWLEDVRAQKSKLIV